MDFLKELNDAQHKAVVSEDGPLLIVAGAGSGKTRVLTYRIAYLINKGLPESSILAVTFTNKAAQEMKNRLKKIIGRKADYLWIGTFHSICARILRREINRLGYKNDFSIYDDYDRRKLIEQCLKDLDIDHKKNPARSIAYMISAAKNELIDSETFKKNATDYKENIASEVYRLYQERLYQNNALDFDDLIMLTVNLFEIDKELLRRYQKNFTHIFIDEYQDTNRAQYRFAALLAEQNNNICVVGDSDQSIYRWRGADIRNIMNFEKDYSDAKVVLLEQNYRSTKNILDAANAVIGQNSKRKEKNLWTAKGKGDNLTLFEASDEHQEANFIARTINNYCERGANHKDFAIFYRVNAQSRVIEEALLKEGIPYRIVGGLKFYERLEIKDILAYLRVLVNETDSLSLMRVINRPKRGIGETTVDRINKYCKQNNLTLYEGLKNSAMIPALSTSVVEKVNKFLSIIEQLKSEIDKPIVEIVTDMLKRSGYVQSLKEADDVESRSRLENINEFLNVVKEFQFRNKDLTLSHFLEEIALITDLDNVDDSEDVVTLMTMHSAKGLEFDVVFIAGMEEGLFPHAMSMNEAAELEEERRLCYVSITRAMKKVFLTNAYSRSLYGSGHFNVRSRFLGEIPKNLLEAAHAPVIHSYESAEFEVGDIISHKKFGQGIITNIEEEKLSIQFEDGNARTLLLGYAPIIKA